MNPIPPVAISGGLAAGTAAIGAILAYGYSQQDAIDAGEAQNLLWAFVLCAVLSVATLLFALTPKKEAA